MSCRFAKKADEYSSGGRKITSTRSGSSVTVSSGAEHEAQHQAADHQHDRVRDVDQPRDRAEHDHRQQQRDEDDLDLVHQTASYRITPPTSALADLAAVDQQVDVPEHLATA